MRETLGSKVKRLFAERRRVKVISGAAAKSGFYKLFEQVKRGQRVIIRRRGKPVCVLEPVVEDKRSVRRLMSHRRGRRRVLSD
jgi:antitoxin (DNA-binding transcriptional repressor) of toxin-antitoxin stability system